jgi:hypothetical protein
MSDSLRLYRNIANFVFKNGMRFHDMRCFATFLWAIVGLLQSKTIHLSKWSVYRAGQADAASKQRRLARWLDNERIRVEVVYEPLIRMMCLVFCGEGIYLALDSSVLWEKYALVRLAVIYCGRAIPLSWVVVSSQSATVAFEKYKVILERAARILPKTCRVTLLADRGFGDRKLFKKALSLGWGFRIRLKSSVWVGHPRRPSVKVGDLMPVKGEALFLHNVWLSEYWFGPVHLALANIKTENGFEEWAIVSDDPTSLKTFDEYGLRFDVEESFLDDKSAGFQLESSEIRDDQALNRLILILAVSTLYLVSCGVQVAQTDSQRRKVDGHWHRGLSYLQIGWRWLFHALSNSFPLPSGLRLLSGQNFEPVFASKKQADQPVATLFGLSLVT